MPKILIKESEHKIEVPILLTAVSGKVRIKNRSIVNEYGTPVAVRRDGFALSNYVEWQIGYDVVKKETDKLAESSLPETEFVGANGKTKALYELSEYIWYFHKWSIVSKEELEGVINYLNSIPDNDLIDNNSELQIDRSHPIAKNINGFNFEYTQVKYPLLIYKFNGYEIVTEIKGHEKWFLFINTKETHYPYDIGEGYPSEILPLLKKMQSHLNLRHDETPLTDKESAALHMRQIRALEAIDKRLETLVASLPQSRSVLIVVCADHGESFGEQFFGFPRCGHLHPSPEVLQVPLLIGVIT